MREFWVNVYGADCRQSLSGRCPNHDVARSQTATMIWRRGWRTLYRIHVKLKG